MANPGIPKRGGGLVHLVRDLTHIIDGDSKDDAYLKVCLYFTLEFRIYLDLFSVLNGIKNLPLLNMLRMRSLLNRNTKI